MLNYIYIVGGIYMALNQKFYQEIYDKEEMWLKMLQSNLINVYYLPELKKFYEEKQKRLDYEIELTGNDLLKSFSISLNNLIIKLDYLIEEDKNNNFINLNVLTDFFLINKLNNNISNIKRISEQKNSLYELRKKIVNENNEDYMDDDFYYNKKTA